MIPNFIFRCFIYLVLFGFSNVQAAKDSDIIDIRGKIYARLSLAIIIDEKATIPAIISQFLKRNLEWSGIFDLHKHQETADTILFLFHEGKQIIAEYRFQEGNLLYEGKLQLIKNQEKQEDEVVRFIEEITMVLTGKKGILGSAILYSEKTHLEPNRIIIVDLHGRKRKVLIEDENYNFLPVWTPKGDGFVFTSTGSSGTKISAYDFVTKEIKTIAAYEGISSGGTWGPDQEKLIVSISNQGNPDLYVITHSGKILRKLTIRSSIDTSASWSPDGKTVLFISNRSGPPQIYQLDMETNEIFRMTFDGNYNTDPRWSKDGANILYAGIIQSKFQIFLMDRDGEHIRQLTYEKISSEQPNWSPDGRQIIFTTKVGYDPKLYLMTSDGAYKRRLTRTGKGVVESTPSWSNRFNWDLLDEVR